MARPQVIAVEPANYAVEVDIASSIKITFDMDIDAGSLSQNIRLFTTWGEQVIGRITYRKKVVTFTPVEPLQKGTNYALTVVGDNNLDDGNDEGIRNILDEYMAGSYTSRFATDSEGVLPAPIVTLPTNNTVINEPPVYSWETVEGAISYDVEISQTNTFSSKLFPIDSTTSVYNTTLSPNIDYDDGIYYWRVRAAGGVNNKGAWSPVMQFNLSREVLGQIAVGDSAFIDATDDVTFTGKMELELIETFPKHLETLVPTNVANLYFRMIGDIDLTTVDIDSLQLIGTHISGDEEEVSHGRVTGKITLVSSNDYTNYIIFTPDPLPTEEEEVEETETVEGEVTP